MFSQLQNLNWKNMAPDVRRKKMDEAIHHLRTSVASVELYVNNIALDASSFMRHHGPQPAGKMKRLRP